MVMHRLATGATAALAFLLSAVADAGDEAPKGGDGDRSFVMDNAGKFIEEAAAAPKKAKWKKKHLLLMAWGGVFLVLWSVAGFFLYRYMNSGKRAASTRDKDTRQKKKEEKAQKQKQKEEDEAPPPAPIEPTIARNVKRKELEEKARVALEAAPKFEMASVEAVRVGPSADQFETRVTRFERELDLLSPVALKELSPGAHSGKPWWGSDVAVHSPTSLEIWLIAGPYTLAARIDMPHKYPKQALNLQLSSEDAPPRALAHLQEWALAQIRRENGPMLAKIIDTLHKGAHARILAFDVEDWSVKEQAALQSALACCPPSMGARDRWDAIATLVDGKTRQQCVDRFRVLRDRLRLEEQRLQAFREAQKEATEEEVEEEEIEAGEAGGRKKKGGGAASRLDAEMLGFDFVSDGEKDEDDEDEEEEDEEDEEDEDEEVQQEGNIVALMADDAGSPHRGTQIKIDQVLLGGCSVVQIAVLRLVISCDRCSTQETVAVTLTSPVHGTCRKCKHATAVAFRPDVLHEFNPSAGYLDLTNCKAMEVLPLDFWLACGGCGQETLVKRLRPGMREEPGCVGCYEGMRFGFGGARLIALQAGRTGVAKWLLGAGEGGGGKKAKDVAVEGLVVGTPLPEKGACKHFRRSRRWLRFPCCGRAFPCPCCHDEAIQGEHETMWATRMICGSCSREQHVHSKGCECGAVPTGTAGGATWQGGEGVRDRTMLEKKDSRHVNAKWAEKKTTSKKSQRVGQAGKRKVAVNTIKRG